MRESTIRHMYFSLGTSWILRVGQLYLPLPRLELLVFLARQEQQITQGRQQVGWWNKPTHVTLYWRARAEYEDAGCLQSCEFFARVWGKQSQVPWHPYLLPMINVRFKSQLINMDTGETWNAPSQPTRLRQLGSLQSSDSFLSLTTHTFAQLS